MIRLLERVTARVGNVTSLCFLLVNCPLFGEIGPNMKLLKDHVGENCFLQIIEA